MGINPTKSIGPHPVRTAPMQRNMFNNNSKQHTGIGEGVEQLIFHWTEFHAIVVQSYPHEKCSSAHRQHYKWMMLLAYATRILDENIWMRHEHDIRNRNKNSTLCDQNNIRAFFVSRGWRLPLNHTPTHIPTTSLSIRRHRNVLFCI